MALWLAVMLFIVQAIPACTLQVSHISCSNRSTVEVHFIANNSPTDLSGAQVDFVMNDVAYVAPWTKTTGSAYHFVTAISVTEAFTATITAASIQSGKTRIEVHNLPFVQYLNCNPTALTLTGFSARASGSVPPLEIGHLIGLGVAAMLICLLSVSMLWLKVTR
jgi:hypothetical protein